MSTRISGLSSGCSRRTVLGSTPIRVGACRRRPGAERSDGGDPLRLRQPVQDAAGAQHLEYLDHQQPAEEIDRRQRPVDVQPVKGVKRDDLCHPHVRAAGQVPAAPLPTR
ncbi:MAG: hypothetical protein ACK4L4_17775 [Gemmobacter sp.]